jgi:hypothetical protein
MKKVTYTLDDGTVGKVKRAAKELGKPQSSIVREAVAQYEPRPGHLSEAERRRILRVLDVFWATAPKRSQRAADAEQREIRRSRRESSLRRERAIQRATQRRRR